MKNTLKSRYFSKIALTSLCAQKTKRYKFFRVFMVLEIYNFGWSQEVGILFFAKLGTRTYLLCPMQKYVLCSTKKEGWTNKIAAILEGLRISRWLLFLACKQGRQQQNSSFLFECLFILFGIPELLLHTVKHICFFLEFHWKQLFCYWSWSR